MNSRTFAQTILAACTLALALNAGAQTSGTNASKQATEQAKAASSTTATSAAAGQPAKTSTNKHHKHHAASHKSSNMQHKSMASARSRGSEETAYQMALRHCVEGPMAQRDSCLDSAVMRYGRS